MIARHTPSVQVDVGNVQDVYPLTPLQEGILFHYLLGGEGDPYLLANLFTFETRVRMNAYLNALQAVIDRHDILRTAVVWEGLSEPMQIVWRKVILPVEEITLDPSPGDAAQQICERFSPRKFRFDIRRAPLLRVYVAHDALKQRWLMMQLLHHLAGDQTTMRLMGEEIAVHLMGRMHELPPPLAFRSIVAQARSGVSREEHEKFFRELLGDITETTAPFGLLDVHGDGTGIEKARLRADADLALRVREQARRLGVSAASLCHVAWGQVIARISGREDVVFGTVLFGRMLGGEAAERTMGLLMNTLPVRILLGHMNPEATVRRTHVQLAELLRHEHASLALAQRCSRIPAPAPLFSALLNYRYHAHGAPARLQPSRFAPEGLQLLYSEEHTNYPLAIDVDDFGPGGFTFTVQTHKSIGPMRMCRFMHTALGSLTAALAISSEQPIRTLEVLPEEERRSVLHRWNNTGVEFTGPACVHELFEEQVRQSPNAPAIAYAGISLSYDELNHRANRLARHLRALGVGPDTRVSICLERSLEMVVALLAVLKAGGAYVPLDPLYPAERLTYMLADSGSIALITEDHLRASFVGASDHCPIVSVNTAVPEWGQLPATNLDRASIGLTPQHLAYLIYTSGSTGAPKGVMIEHRSVSNYLRWALKMYAPFTGAIVSSSISFDATAFSLYLPLISGSTARLLPPGEEVDGLNESLRSIDDCGLVFLTPTLADVLGERLLADGVHTSIGVLSLGGEALTNSTIQLWRKIQPGLRIVNEYGPTETCIGCIGCEIPQDIDPQATIPIGSPIANTRAYILDPHGQPTPVGVAGELYIAGAGLARAYLNQPELTAERFLKDPFVPDGSARMYKTGDLGRRVADGTIEFLGRNDFQIKIRGFRIELGEIEARLQKHGAVKDALVVAREDEDGDKRLVAYYTCIDPNGSNLTADALRAHVSAALPSYMVPAAYVRMESLPVTTSGKLDRKALPQPHGDAFAVAGYEAPIGEVENNLASLWAEVLKLERVGRHDNFFALGGHSLLTVPLIERMRRKGYELDIRTLFKARTLAELAATLGQGQVLVQVPPNRIPENCTSLTPEMLSLVDLTAEEIERVVRFVPGGAANVQDIYPLSPLQEGILFHHALGKGDPYLSVNLFRWGTRAGMDAYIRAMQAVIDRHDILRTSVIWEGLSEPVQVVWRSAILPVEEAQLNPQAGDGISQLTDRFSPRRNRIDVQRAPMLRVYVAYDSVQQHWLMMLLLHHLVGDHTTAEVMREEIDAYLMGRADRLPPPLPFRNSVAQARLGVSREEHEAFFRELLVDVEEPSAPFGLTDVQGDGTGIEEARLKVDTALALRIREQARKLAVSAASLAHVAWAQVVARTSACQNVVFGTVLLGRMEGQAGSDRAMGLFMNTLPVKIRIGGDGAATTVRRTHALLADLLRHEHAPLALAQRCSRVAPPTPLFSSLLNYRHTARASRADITGSREAETDMRALRREEERTNYPFTLAVDDVNDDFWLTAQVHAPVGARRVCQFMHTALGTLAAALETSPESAVCSLEVVPEEERRQVLYGWNETRVEYPNKVCIQELFEEQVKKSPEAVAVVYEEQSLSYEELNRRANQLGHYLRGMGVKPDDRVAICVERSVEMVVGLLGVLKAGGAYVPLDPAYPVERLRFMLQDSSASVLLSQDSLKRLFSGLLESINVIDVTEQAWRNWPQTDPERGELTADHLAYLVYTSGSAGTPKGVMVAHRGLNNLTIVHKKYLNVVNSSRILQFASFSFDGFIFEVVMALCQGASLYIMRDALVGQALEEVVNRNGITHAILTPAVLAAMPERATLHSIHTLIASGDVLPRGVAKRWGTGRRLINGYGPTETTVCATLQEYSPESAEELPIGRPIGNTRIYILDAQRQPVPVGVVGELYIAGVGVARGYLKQEELTAERFLVDPFEGDGRERMYKTGDLGKWLADGTIEFVGRNDYQVKIRGFRIELGEIEARLGEHGGVREAVVVAREDAAGGEKRLVAYYTSGEGQEVSAEGLREHLSAKLPEYMVPAAYVRLESLPLTANGKLDRKALPAPDGEAYAKRDYEAPVGEIETTLARIWAELLRVEQVGRNDHFFALGGHSLLTLRVASALQQTGIHIEPVQMFTHPTVALLAAEIEAHGAGSPRDEAVCFRAAGDGPPLFVAHDGAEDLSYVPLLARYVDSTMPIYGLPASKPRLRTVEALAKRMVRMMRAVQPSGPYRICGWSLGGLLAYQIALELIGMDESVSFVGMFDTLYIPGMATIPEDMTPGLDEWPDLWYAQPLPVPVHLFAAQDAAGDPLRGWDSVLSKDLLRVSVVPGTHLSMMHPPNLESLGEILSRAILGGPLHPPSLAEKSWSPLVPLRSGPNSAPPLFCVPGAGANVTSFMDLATCLSGTWPVYGLQPRGMDGELVPWSTVAAATASYLRAINEVYPHGPVHLLGHSFGGWVVFEAAQSLAATGRTIASLTMLDTSVPDDENDPAIDYNHIDVILHWIQTFELILDRPLNIKVSDLHSRSEAQQRRILHNCLVQEGLMPRRSHPDVLQGPLRTFGQCVRTRYVPQRLYTAPVHLILVDHPKLDEEANRENRTDIVRGWTRRASNLTSIHGPGNHLTVLKPPHVQILADIIQKQRRDTAI